MIHSRNSRRGMPHLVPRPDLQGAVFFSPQECPLQHGLAVFFSLRINYSHRNSGFFFFGGPMFRYDADLDIGKSTDDVLVNTVNCVGKMGKGVALAIAEAYPSVLAPYKRVCATGRLKPGLIHIHRVPDGPIIINMATKDHYRNPSRPDWVGSGLFFLSRFLQQEIAIADRPIRSVTMPPPGCGNGGLDWQKVHVMARNSLAPLTEMGVSVTFTDAAPGILDLPMRVAGVGSRKTPQHVLDLMRVIGGTLAGRGYILRSGGAFGADSAFERGFSEAGGRCEIFRKSDPISPLFSVFTRNLHPKPDALSEIGTLLMNRNGAQIFGADIDTPVDILICWTPSGNGEGGTGQAIRIARSCGIPVLDLGLPEYADMDASHICEIADELARQRRAQVTDITQSQGITEAPRVAM